MPLPSPSYFLPLHLKVSAGVYSLSVVLMSDDRSQLKYLGKMEWTEGNIYSSVRRVMVREVKDRGVKDRGVKDRGVKNRGVKDRGVKGCGVTGSVKTEA